MSDITMLQVIAPAPFGGAESVLRSLAHAYPGKGTVAALLQPPGAHPFVDLLRAEGVAVEELRCGRRRYLREARALERLARSTGTQVFHTHVYHADFVGYLAARRCGAVTVAHMHGIPGGDWKDRLYQRLDLRLLRHFDAVVCVSEPLRDRVVAAGCDESRVFMVPNPYSAPRLLSRAAARERLGVQGERSAIGWIGRMRAEKGVDLFLRAFARMAEPRPLAVIVGDGVDMAPARALATELGVVADVVFAGEQANAGELLNAFDVVAISSRNEGLPMVLLEAMGAGVPVVSFALGGIPTVLDERTGWAVTPGDLTGLAAGMTAVMTDPQEAAQRSAAASALVQARHGAGPWGARIHEIHRETLDRRKRD